MGAKRADGMIFWLVIAPVVALLLALAGANWKVFHLVYCRHLIKSADPDKRYEGLARVISTHMRQGMGKSEVEDLVRPQLLKRAEGGSSAEVYEIVLPSKPDQRCAIIFTFDKNGLRNAELFAGDEHTGAAMSLEYGLGK